jgi:hypothetical protein
MRLLTWASIGVLSLTLGISTARAQDEPKRPEEPKPAENEARPQQTPADHDKQEMKQEQNKDLQNRAPKEQTKEEKQQQKDDAKAAKDNAARQGDMNRAQANQGQMNHAQAANGKSGRIPDKDFKAHFGRQHTVVVNQPVIVEGQPRFQYSGYWFAFSNPWPAGWAYTDSCYIDYVDGEYILYDLLHPGVQVVLVIVG